MASHPPHRPAPVPAAEADSLAGFLAAVAAPLDFLLRSSAAAASRVTVPAAALAARGRALLGRVSQGECERVTEICAALELFEGHPPPNRTAWAREVRELVAQLGLPVVSGKGGSEPRPYVPQQAHPGRGGSEIRPPAPAAQHPAPAYHRTSADLSAQLEGLAQPVQFVRGVGPQRAEQFRKLGLRTIEDLLYHLPFRYEDRRAVRTVRDLRVGEEASVIGEIAHLSERYVGRGQRRILEGAIKDETGFLALTWYHQVAYFKNRYRVGQRCLVHGKVEAGSTGLKRIVHPEIDLEADASGQGVLPVYNKPTAMSVGVMRKIVQQAVNEWSAKVPSALPQAVVAHARVSDLTQALQQVHVPARDADVTRLNALGSAGHRSLVFDELFYLQLGLALKRRSQAIEAGRSLPRSGELTDRLGRQLPFALTAAQRRVIDEIYADLRAPHPMHRLIQGDVGSGKTIVALFAALVAVENGLQAAFMAPTELLAEQHFSTVGRWAEELGLRAALLTGEQPRAQRRTLEAQLASGDIQIAVGTHALIQEGVRFKAVGLGVIDEQHRFGVMQRAALRALGGSDSGPPPDILLLSATPIPRTLAMTLYGDLDISLLDEMPPGRQTIRTLVYRESDRQKVYTLAKRELDAGRQGYVVYPLVDPSDKAELRDATTMANELARTVFAGYRVGLIHGRMKGSEKDQVMRRFKAGDLQLLVSTTVIEVGIDVPNATLMVIEHAERFGLAQLHQLRGRVGRGNEASTCILVGPVYAGDDAYRRLKAMERTTDGFKIAEIDLEIRGPGDFLGTRQSGLPDFRVANLIRDSRLLDEARRAADAWLQRDPTLSTPESAPLRAVLRHRWAGRLELAEIG
ncbi:MAG TPA: ATP-dependent DNA helicase RecG [Candidatus Kryptonia bacterium]|nr:ATP-dependent DNA helicase RecG [Candidatus Kryptonia bacterium]